MNGIKDQIKGLQHLGLPVFDMETSIEFYSKIGFQAVYQTVLERDEPVSVAFMEQKGLVIELYRLSGAEWEEIRSRTDGHWDHVALDVDDIDVVFEEVKKFGWPVLEGEPQFLPFFEKGVRYFAVRGPSGEKVEFNQRMR